MANLVSQNRTDGCERERERPRTRAPDITKLAIEEEEKEGINVKERWHDDIAVGRPVGRGRRQADFQGFPAKASFQGRKTGEPKQAEDTSQVSSGL